MLTDTEMMRNENCQLRNIVEDQKQQLDACHTQLSCSKKQLAQLELAAACAGTQVRVGGQESYHMSVGSRWQSVICYFAQITD